MVIIPLIMLVVPWFDTFQALIYALLSMGLILGFIENTSNLAIIKVFQENSGPFLQTLHFSYGVGAFLTPIFSKPFLSNENCAEQELTHKTNVREHGIGQIHNVFLVATFLTLPGTLLTILYAKTQRRKATFYIEVDQTSSAVIEKLASHDRHWCLEILNLPTLFIFLIAFLFDGMQSSFSDLSSTFAMETFKNSGSSEAAFTPDAFWAGFTLGRFISIYISTFLCPSRIVPFLMTSLIAVLTVFATVKATHLTMATVYALFFLIGISLSSGKNKENVYPFLL